MMEIVKLILVIGGWLAVVVLIIGTGMAVYAIWRAPVEKDPWFQGSFGWEEIAKQNPEDPEKEG